MGTREERDKQLHDVLMPGDMIPIFSNTLGDEEIEAVRRVFDSKWIGMGKEVQAFEGEFARFTKCKNVLMTNSCTSALYIAMRTLDIKNRHVLIPSIHFNGVASAVIEAGGEPRYVDVDPDTLNVDPQKVEPFLKDPHICGIVLNHYGGWSCDYDRIQELQDEWHFYVVEDAACAPFSKYKGTPCGMLGDVGCFSFDSMKILCVGDGGALCSKHDHFIKKLKSMRYLGFPNKNKSGTDSAKDGNGNWWEYDIDEPSLRHTSNDIVAAIAREQLKKVPAFLERRKQIWEYYNDRLEGIVKAPPQNRSDCESSYYLYWIQVEKRDELARYLLDHNVYTTFRYHPLHRVKALNPWADDCPVADHVADRTLNLPIHQNLTDHDVDKIVHLIRRYYD